ncbi:hypothetical protein [Nonomuraea sp. NPDC002799]
MLTAAVLGAAVWWFRRDSAGGIGETTFDTAGTGGWGLRLSSEAEAAFMEGLRAYRDAGHPLSVAGEQGVLTVDEPPLLISLQLLADGFAARGDAAMHDPQGTVAGLMAWCADAERPGVLHLRRDWLAGEVDGMDRTRFAEAVRGIVCAGGDDHATADDGAGSLRVTVIPTEPAPTEPASTEPAPTEPASTEPAPVEEASPQVNGKLVHGAAGTLVEERPGGTSRDEGGSPDANTLMLDLARVLDRYREARAERPDAAAAELLREATAHLVTAGGPGLTWVRPPTGEERQTVLTAASSSELR